MRSADESIGTYLTNLEAVWVTGIAREHSHRPALADLLRAELHGLTPINEPAQVECGAPDFVILKDTVPVGHVEAKDLGADLRRIAESEQIRRYRAALPNLILTNYLEFIWFVDGTERRRVTLATKGRNSSSGLKRLYDNYSELNAVLREFGAQVTPQITTAPDLARRLASVANLIKSSVSIILRLKAQSALRDQLTYFRRVLSLNMTAANFADVYAQTITYGLFSARCFHNTTEPFTRQQAAYDLPKSNPFLRSIYSQLAGPEIEPSLVWVTDHLADVLNRTNIDRVLEQFATEAGRGDPVFYFYEDFLSQYDPDLKELRGVYYTPEPVVDYIVRSIHELLSSTFGLERGLADRSKVVFSDAETPSTEAHRVMILDPAVGTGTFLASTISLEHCG